VVFIVFGRLDKQLTYFRIMLPYANMVLIIYACFASNYFSFMVCHYYLLTTWKHFILLNFYDAKHLYQGMYILVKVL